MHIKEKLKGIDFLFKKVCANRNSIFPAKIKAGNIEMKREIKHSFDIPSGTHSNKFSIVVRDKVSFHPGTGPFDIEIVVVGFSFLKEKIKTSKLNALLKDSDNINFLINQCLPHTSAAVAYLTDKMGFSPIILAPKFPFSREE
ncbi:MAG: hypothetical protein HY026_08255 [Deltaproteobacteria bacterium]|nr:hypothetical protein [Deltaproteobacteria bacterium]